MLDWLRKMSCVSTHEEILHGGISENNINRFKVLTDPSLTSDSIGGQGVRSGILEVNDDELVHYQNNAEPIKWSYRCLRRYGLGNNTFLFESGRRCSTGPGLFAFKCAQADILHNIFTEKLKRFASTRSGTMGTNSLHRRSEFLTSQAPNRYSDDMMIASNMAACSVVEEPYLTPLPPNQNYANGEIINGHNHSQSYVNCTTAGQGSNADADYVNTGATAETGSRSTSVSKAKGAEDGRLNGAAIRELNYADLDLPQSNAVGFNQTPRKPKTGAAGDNMGLQYVNLPHSSDDEMDDDAFLPDPYHSLSVDLAGHRTESATVGYMNVQNGSSNARKPVPPLAPAAPSSTQYTTIDFHKTAAIASTAKSTHQSDSNQEGLRKTRHDSSADNLN